ncbi:MAG: polysaccharide deacetylase family protein, partial [Hyphomicrobiales bacterium]|nr:polysaccharide deacetylase family protein [Hyphomicrobiales bacterium]
MLRLAIAALIASTIFARADSCPRPDALGTARVLTVDPKTYPRVGTQSFPDTLPLQDREVVLTFDDGPNPPTTSKILAALAHECVRATFFVIGQSAAAHPQLVKRMAAEGHTIAHHTFAHADLKKIDPQKAIDQIDRGIAA